MSSCVWYKQRILNPFFQSPTTICIKPAFVKNGGTHGSFYPEFPTHRYKVSFKDGLLLGSTDRIGSSAYIPVVSTWQNRSYCQYSLRSNTLVSFLHHSPMKREGRR